jgi:hypothetical protein
MIDRATLRCGVEDLSGRRFSAWLVEGPCRDHNDRLAWWCHCDCGVSRSVIGSNLIRGISESCGHGRRSKGRHPIGEGQRLFRIWRAMLMRCDPDGTYADHEHYRRHGIRVCKAWHDYDAFADWALANGYRDDLTIDRIDNERGYEAENCRWVDDETQRWNKRGLIQIEIGGQRVPLAKAIRGAGLDYNKALRLHHRGLSFPQIAAALGSEVAL